MASTQTTPLHSEAGGAHPLRVNQRFIPDVPVFTHRGEHVRFYSDLLQDRILLIHFMSIANHRRYPVTPNLVQLQSLLENRQGQPVRLLSITAEPGWDTIDLLAKFAASQGVRMADWHFITGADEHIAAIKRALFVHRGQHEPVDGVNRQEFMAMFRHKLSGYPAENFCAQPGDAGRDCSMGLMRYGNEARDLWGSVPAKANPQLIIERLDWIDPQTAPRRSRRLRRGGPFART